MLEGYNFPEYTKSIASDFDYVYEGGYTYAPHEDSIRFKGPIYLLVDKMVYSSSEKLATFAKESGFATLVGGRTAGDGIGSDPYIVGLPNTGYMIRFSKELGITGQGSINEVDHTKPHITAKTKMDVVERENEIRYDKDECIKAVLKDLGM